MGTERVVCVGWYRRSMGTERVVCVGWYRRSMGTERVVCVGWYRRSMGTERVVCVGWYRRSMGTERVVCVGWYRRSNRGSLYRPRERDVAPWFERSLMVRCVVRSILHGGPIELFLVLASAPRLV